MVIKMFHSLDNVYTRVGILTERVSLLLFWKSLVFTPPGDFFAGKVEEILSGLLV